MVSRAPRTDQMFVVPPLGQSLKGLGNVGRSQQSLKPKREDECAHGFNMLNTYINIYIIYVHYYALSISTIIYNIYIYILCICMCIRLFRQSTEVLT